MFLQDFDTSISRFTKIQKYLRENHKCEIAIDKLKYSTASSLIEETAKKMSSISDKSSKDYVKFQMIKEGLEIWKKSPLQYGETLEEAIDDDSVDEAKVIISAQDLSIELQKIIEKLSELQVQTLIPIIDKMKSEIGIDAAEKFNSSVDSAFGQLLNSAKQTKDSLNDAILVASGKSGPTSDISDISNMDDLDNDMKTFDKTLDMPEIGPETRQLKEPMKSESIDYNTALLELKKHSKNGKIDKKTLESIKIRAKK
jgi:hypothetical protein